MIDNKPRNGTLPFWIAEYNQTAFEEGWVIRSPQAPKPIECEKIDSKYWRILTTKKIN